MSLERERTCPYVPNLSAARARARSASSRDRAVGIGHQRVEEGRADRGNLSIARSKASSFAFDGLLKPESFLTNCSDARDLVLGRRRLEIEKGLDVAAHGRVGSSGFWLFVGDRLHVIVEPSTVPTTLLSGGVLLAAA